MTSHEISPFMIGLTFILDFTTLLYNRVVMIGIIGIFLSILSQITLFFRDCMINYKL
ncbi:hypothetical protein APU01nite_16810 [Alkalibacterium putridalgicola]|uniref:Uncharacterized protein n=1 Tax=Alkalibacterium putridalgicola TaxID=426703 RepID=A0ABQ0UZ06_9LACT|nr:hypothetical protein APU01nite_16810 [Alkalibacterium putridalgicola]